MIRPNATPAGPAPKPARYCCRRLLTKVYGVRHAAYRHFPQAIPAYYAIKKFDRAPCVRGCPANLSVQGYVQLIKAGKFPEALSLIMDRLPLPGTIGRICPHPCETDCRRQEVDEPLAICNLKRFVRGCRGLDGTAGTRGETAA